MNNLTLLKSFYDAFARADVPTVLNMMSADIKWHQAENNPYQPSGEAWVGPDAVLNNLFIKLVTEWEGFSVHPHIFHNADDSVIVEARYTGVYKASGKQLDAQVCHVWQVEADKIIGFQQYIDTAHLQAVMTTS